MAYLYETHVHTSQSSACGLSLGREYIAPYIDLGYTGIIITDHFYRGNCAVNRALPWAKWVEKFCSGYEDAMEEGLKRGLDVFFGWEETYDVGDDYLVYGLDKKWLLEHPQVIRWSLKKQFDEVRRYGGCVVQAHPFRQRSYISRIRLSSGCVDAVEAGNLGNADPSFDALAMAYARKLNLPFTAGSDMHNASGIGSDTVFGVYLDKKLESIADYVNIIRNKEIGALRVPPDRFVLRGDERVTLPVDIRNSRDQRTGRDLWDFLGL